MTYEPSVTPSLYISYLLFVYYEWFTSVKKPPFFRGFVKSLGQRIKFTPLFCKLFILNKGSLIYAKNDEFENILRKMQLFGGRRSYI
jgi:hypothetical protein